MVSRPQVETLGERHGQAPKGLISLGGLVTSTAVNMLVLPALYQTFGRRYTKRNDEMIVLAAQIEAT